MKKLFNICLLCLLAIAAAAQTTHQLKVTWQPLGSITMYAHFTNSQGEYMSYSSEKLDAFDMLVPAGQKVSLSGYGQGFVLKEVTANGQSATIETTSDYGNYYFEYDMPDSDVELAFIFEYDPAAPDFQPGDSGWYPETGTLVWDHNMWSYPPNFNIEEDAAKVLRLILGGKRYYDVSSSDVVNFPNCYHLDYCRTDATECSYGQDWSQTAVTEIVLPSTMQTLEEHAFDGAHLQSLTCFAMTPPQVEKDAFPAGLGMTVYVPEDAVPLYQNANGWKDFTILPIEANSVTLSVNLIGGDLPSPALEEALAPYKNMHLELTSLNTGQVRRLLVGSRNTYEFRYLPTNTSYSLVLRTASGAVVGSMELITMGEQDENVVFGQLKTPRTLALSVIADGQQVEESLYTATWLTDANAFIARGSQLSGMLEGQQLRLFVALDRELALKYEQPDTVVYTVGANGADNGITLTLNALPTTTVHFIVLDQRTGLGINKASINISQLLMDGTEGNSQTLTTDFYGKAEGTVLSTPSAIRVVTDVLGTKSFMANLNDSTDFTVRLRPAEGTQILLNYTYQAVAGKDEESQASQGYANNRNLRIEFDCDGVELTDYRDQNPRFTLAETLPTGSRIRIKAVSIDQDVEDAEVVATVGDDGVVRATLPLVQRGAIHASYTVSDTEQPGILLFNAGNGQLRTRTVFNGMNDGNYREVSFSNVQSGDYVLVAMSQGEQFNALRSLSQLSQLEEGKDYLRSDLQVAGGVLSEVAFGRIPKAVTNIGTNLKVHSAPFNMQVATVGEYVTVNIKAQFNPGMEGKATDIQVEFDCPDGLKFIPVAIFGNKVSVTQGTLVDGKVIIPFNELADGSEGSLGICFTAQNAGNYWPTASITYKIDGEEHRDYLTTTTLDVQEAKLTVHELAITPTIYVSGTDTQLAGGAMARATKPLKENHRAIEWGGKPADEVFIMDGDEEIGRTYINSSDGRWSTPCQLANPTPLSKHQIWAKIYKDGRQYQTEAKTVTYDPSGVIPLTVDMMFFNYHPVHLMEQKVHFDVYKQFASPKSYGFNNEVGYNTDFTFEINLSNNDPKKVKAVILYVYTKGSEAKTHELYAHYNQRKNRWIAYDKYNTEELPYDVKVEVYYKGDHIGSRQKLQEALDLYKLLVVDEVVTNLETIIEQKIKDHQPVDEIVDLVYQHAALCGAPLPPVESVEPPSNDELAALIQRVDSLAEWADQLEPLQLSQVSSIGESIEIGTCEGMTEQSLLADGYEAMKLDDGSSFYVRLSENASMSIVLLKDNLTILFKGNGNSRAPRREGEEDWNYLQEVKDAISELGDHISWLEAIVGAALDFVNPIVKDFEDIDKALTAAFIDNKGSEAVGNAMIKNLRTLGKLKTVQKGLEHLKRGKVFGTLGALWGLYNDFVDHYNKLYSIYRLHNSIPEPCPDDMGNAALLKADLLGFGVLCGMQVLSTITGDIAAIAEACTGMSATLVTGGISAVAGGLLALCTALINYNAKQIYEAKYHENMFDFINRKHHLVCYQKTKKEDHKKCTGNCGDGGVTGGTIPTLDPSGFVYEGVESNRVEGATATVFYKKQTKDMWGDPVDVVTVWDAENYGQVNPQFTDENGEYGWMVPEGLWQVKYEKEGYQTEFSEWLPVPPPQLDVNQNLIQYSQPVVSGVKATQEGVQVQFDKYMRPITLTTQNIHVTRQGQQLQGSIELLNAEEHDGQQLASKVFFKPTESLPVGQTLVLTVGGDVQSYAKVAMGDVFTQEFDIVQAVEEIVADSAINVIYDQTYELTIKALPAAAAAGQQVKVRLLSDVVASADADMLTFDANGKATLRITGDVHGTTGLILQMANDEDVQKLVVVSVKDESDFVCPMPTANYISGTQLYYGTAVELSSEMPGATIYYTLDGSCPCDQDMKYTGPIAITADTHIKAIAVADGYTDSEIKELRYTVRRDATRLHLPQGWTWVSHAQQNDVPLSKLGEQTAYAIDEQGMQTNTLQPATAYKTYNDAAHDVLLEGIAWNAATGLLNLNYGWNWMPYPVPMAMTPAEAMAYALPEDGEVLVGEEGFAIYENSWDGSAWIGTLQRLEPGHAYMYKSANNRPYFLNTTVVESQSQGVQPPVMFRWYDRHAQPNRMPVVAQLIDANGNAVGDLDRYQLMAWTTDDVCRGNGYWNPRRSVFFMNVLGQGGEQIEFRVYDKQMAKTYSINETVAFTADLVGTLSQPLQLHMGGELSGINDVQSSTSNVQRIYDLQGRKVETPKGYRIKKGVYIKHSEKVVVK
ncbi:MAG: chitobiase/beta-hexosaminidase C-terminal domain-containing protein [Prevotella sp.]|nr:chitobiase/beta-hexosaminidase C-terminal domain-containing protein [Prevotella sp.]